MAPSTTLRRLLKEVSELSSTTTNPNPTFYAAPVSDADLHEWHFTILGPPSPSPYAGGLYHGRISLPAQYPYKPPNFRFLTPSGRFEVNREICLSISGFHEETWMPAWGVRTALVALRSFMAEAGTAGQVGGLESSDQVRQRLATESKTWRCSDCGKTNQEVMSEWWDTCREAGVKVDEEDMDLEALPEGLDLKPKDKGKGKEKEESSGAETGLVTQPAATHAQQQTQPQDAQTIPLASHVQTQSLSQPQSAVTQPTTGSETVPTQQSSKQVSSSSPLVSRSQTPPSGRTHTTSPSQSQFRSQPINQPNLQVQPQSTQSQTDSITLDRAITAVFLALCLMVLKKIFYPSSTSTFGGDELEMLKEW